MVAPVLTSTGFFGGHFILDGFSIFFFFLSENVCVCFGYVCMCNRAGLWKNKSEEELSRKACEKGSRCLLLSRPLFL